MIISSEVSHTAMIISLRCDVNRVWLAVGDDRPAWENIADLGAGVKSWWSRWDTLHLRWGVLQVKWARADGGPHLEDRRTAD